jgi:hypothetical protein
MDCFLPEPLISPIQVADQRGIGRQRARRGHD